MSPRSRILLALLVAAAAAGLYASGMITIRGRTVRCDSAGVQLEGTLATPRFAGSRRLPAVVVVHGSGPTTRAALRGYAARLVPRGFAVLIHDKRGTGHSGGTFDNVGLPQMEEHLEQLAADVAAWVELLRARPDIDPERIGLVGGSQAGWIMPLVAAHDPRIAFLAAISGPTVTLAEEDLYSTLTGDDPGEHAPGELTGEEIQRRLAAYSGPAWFDPAPHLVALDIPSLWLFGGMDASVPTELCRRRIEQLPESARANFEVRWYPQGDHSLREPGGSSTGYWTDLTAWLVARAGLD